MATSLHAQTGKIIEPDEGDSFWQPNPVHQLPFDRTTCIQTSSDLDYFRFTAPANMEIRVRASATWLQDPSITLFSPSGHVWDQDDDSGHRRNAELKFQAIGGQEYVVAVTNRRSGTCRIRIDSTQIVARFNEAPAEESYGLDRSDANPTWAEGNHFGTEHLFSYVKRRLQLQAYCLDDLIIDDIFLFSDNDQFIETREFDLPVLLNTRPLSMVVEFSPLVEGNHTEWLDFHYRVDGDPMSSFTRMEGFAVDNLDVSVLRTQDHGFSSGGSDEFNDREDAARYHQFRAAVGGAAFYRAVVLATPKSSDRFDLAGTVFANGWDSGQIGNDWGKGFMHNTVVRSGQPMFVKTEIKPDDLALRPEPIVQFPARYNLHVYFIPL